MPCPSLLVIRILPPQVLLECCETVEQYATADTLPCGIKASTEQPLEFDGAFRDAFWAFLYSLLVRHAVFLALSYARHRKIKVIARTGGFRYTGVTEALMKRQRNSIGFFTYNPLPGIANGWHEGINGRRAFVLASPERDIIEAHNEWGPSCQPLVSAHIARLWPQFERELDHLSHFVFYLGGAGCATVIVKIVGFVPPQRTLFVHCTCGLFTKLLFLCLADFITTADGLHQIQCECGGQETMTRLIRSFLQQRIWMPGH